MGNIDPNMAGTPDPKDTWAVGIPETNGAGETTVFQPVGLVEDTENTDAAGEDTKKPRPKWLVPAIAAGVAVIVLGAGVGGYAYALNNVNAGVQADSSWNAASAKTLKKTVEDAQALLDETGEDKVADPQVLEALSSAIDKAQAAKGADVSANGMFVWELLDAENAYDESTASILDLDASLDKAMKAVEKSVAEKMLADAKNALSKAIDSAQSTLDDSDGKVQDNATRDALSKAIDTAKKAMDGDDAEAMNTAKSDLDAKTKAVNDSVKAKEQADAEAKAQAEAAANTAASVNSGYTGYTGGGYSNYTGGGYTGGYAGGSYSGGSGSSPTYDWRNDYDSMGNPTTPLEGDSWDYVESW
ncbi:hypothetical protein [uncultured Bifidobacterium sp.]|uniref:hypothetical protein n=1 Tax=uncultured Bifidobacterium sp. TaxID=165187 RepID=UPI0027DC030C|nr:hypothetical protein [uncultured Bifidobacterium sp.]